LTKIITVEKIINHGCSYRCKEEKERISSKAIHEKCYKSISEKIVDKRAKSNGRVP
jgi:hypothetical protein